MANIHQLSDSNRKLCSIMLDYYYGLFEESTNVFKINGIIENVKFQLRKRSQLGLRKIPGQAIRPGDVATNLIDLYLISVLESLSSVSLNSISDASSKIAIIKLSFKEMQGYIENFDISGEDYEYPYHKNLFIGFERILQTLLQDNTYKLEFIPHQSGTIFTTQHIVKKNEQVSGNVLHILSQNTGNDKKNYVSEGLTREQSDFLQGYIGIFPKYSYAINSSNKDITKETLEEVIHHIENMPIGSLFISNIINILLDFYSQFPEKISKEYNTSERNTYLLREIQNFNEILFKEIIASKNHSNTLTQDQNATRILQEKFPALTLGQSAEIITPDFKKRA